MDGIFAAVLNMSLTAGYVIIIVILARLLLRKAPKVISYALWSVVAFRLVFPFSFESTYSLVPKSTTVAHVSSSSEMNIQQKETNRQQIIYKTDDGAATAKTYAKSSFPAASGRSDSVSFPVYVRAGKYIWIAGVTALLLYSLFSFLLLKKQLKHARFLEGNVFEADNLRTPFVLGLIKPRIYLPSGLGREEQAYILLHERIHIQRKDHFIKAIAFLILTVHWFNPLVWAAFLLMSKDMELSCDEKVLRLMREDIRKPYANSLLSLAAGRHILNGSPVAFGEGNVKERIVNVLNYKKPGFWILFLSILLAVAVGTGLAANPKSAGTINGWVYNVKDILYQSPLYSFVYRPDTAPRYAISSDYKLYGREVSDGGWNYYGSLYRCEISSRDLYDLFVMPDDSVYDSIKKLKTVYRADTGDDAKTFYLLMQLNDGEILLAAGYDNENNSHIRWLFGLEKTEIINDETFIEAPDAETGTGKESIAEFVEENLAIIMSSSEQFSDPDACIQAHREEYEKIIKHGGEKALQYMLSRFEYGDAEGLRGQIMMRLCKDLLGERKNATDEKDENLTPQKWFEAQSAKLEVKLPDFEYDGNDRLEKLVYETETERYSDPRRGFTVVAPEIFGSYEEDGMLKVFVTTYSATYRLYGNVLEETGGSVVPSAITYKKDGNGGYVLEEYQQAKDGADFAPSIREFCTMPVSGKKIRGLADKIIDHYANRDDIQRLHYENLYKHLKANGINDAILYYPDGEVEFSMSDYN